MDLDMRAYERSYHGASRSRERYVGPLIRRTTGDRHYARVHLRHAGWAYA